MGFITSGYMLPVIIFWILWKEGSEEQPVTLDKLCNLVLEVYETKTINLQSFKRRVARIVAELEDTLLVLSERGYISDIRLVVSMMKQEDSVRSRCRSFFIKRLFSDQEICLLCDSVLASPGISLKQSKHFIEKIVKLASRQFVNVFKQIRCTDIIERTANEDVFMNLKIISDAIRGNRKVRMIYNGILTVVSPYYLVISMGKYYLLCCREGKNTMAHYRVDKMTCMCFLPSEKRIPLADLTNIDGRNFSLTTYMRQHPRMYTDEPVEVAILVKEKQMPAVRFEFYIKSVRSYDGEDYDYRVLIKSPKLAIANWIVNTANLVTVVEDYGCGLIDMLKVKAAAVMEIYGSVT